MIAIFACKKFWVSLISSILNNPLPVVLLYYNSPKLYNPRWTVEPSGGQSLSQVINDNTRGNGLRLQQGRSALYIEENFFMEMVVRHWHKLPRTVVESTSLAVFKQHVAVALGDIG